MKLSRTLPRTLQSAALLSLLGIGLPEAVHAFPYTITNLGLYTRDGARPLAVNNIGEMGGFSTAGLTGTKNAFSSSAVPNITITNLHTRGGNLLGGYSGSYAAGINEAGQVVGQALRTNISAYVPFIATNGGTMTEFNPLGGTAGGGGRLNTARDINNVGQVVGGAYTAGNTANHAYVYNTGTGTGTDIGARIAGSGTSEAFGINDAGQVAGMYYTSTFAQRAFLYDGSSVTTIATPGGGNAYATGINGSGSVVGAYFTGTYPSIEKHAFLYSGGNLTDLGAFYAIEARGINDAGQIVGGATLPGSVRGTTSAFLYQNGVMTDLNSLIDPAAWASLNGSIGYDPLWKLVDAYAISNTGYIVGSAISSYPGTSFGAAVILTPAVLNPVGPITSPVPEPEVYVTLLAGLGLLGAMARRRNQANHQNKA